MFDKINKIGKEESGQSVVIIAIAMVVILGFAAFAVDIGYASHQKSILQNAADSAALAGAVSLHTSDDGKVKEKVIEYVNANLKDTASVDTTIDRTKNTVQVSLSQESPKFFAGVISLETRAMAASATAKTWAGEALPFINLDDNFTIGSTITLWEKLKYGDFERLWADISKDDTVCVVQYNEGVFFDSGVVANVKKFVEYCYEQDKDLYVFSLKNDLIEVPVDKINNKHLFQEDTLVLLRVHITSEPELNSNKRGINVIVKEVIPDFTNMIPNAKPGGESKAILID